jgi:hypothetical protein
MGGQASINTYYTHFNGTQSGWIPSSASVSVALVAGKRPDKYTQNVLTQGFAPYKGMHNRDAFFDAVALKTANTTVYKVAQAHNGATRIITPYMMATRAWSKDDEQPSQSLPRMLLSRGVLIETTYTTDSILGQVSPSGLAFSYSVVLHACIVEVPRVVALLL